MSSQHTSTRFYSVFGGCLETHIDFPELRLCSRRDPRWVLSSVSELSDRRELKEVGDQHIYGDVHARLYSHESGFRIVVDDTGRFDIEDNGSRITIEEKDGAWPDFVRAHVVGRVMATALFSRGLMPLHGSAVQLESGVVGFLAPKGFGKSTIALALVQSGGKLVTDDTLPIELGSIVRAWPGVHSVRIADDSRKAVGIGGADLETREGKGVVTSLADEQLAMLPAELSAIYLLQPIDSSRGSNGNFPPKVGRSLLPTVPAAVSLVTHFKLARMTGSTSQPEVLRRAAAIADAVPVYNLFLDRDLGALPEVTAQIREWHSVAEATFSAAGGHTK